MWTAAARNPVFAAADTTTLQRVQLHHACLRDGAHPPTSPLGRSHSKKPSTYDTMPACGQAVGCGGCDTPELWLGAAGLCARVRACAGAAESLHTYILARHGQGPDGAARMPTNSHSGEHASQNSHYSVRTQEKACSSDPRFRRELSGTTGHRRLGTQRPHMLCVAAWVWFCLSTEFMDSHHVVINHPPSPTGVLGVPLAPPLRHLTFQAYSSSLVSPPPVSPLEPPSSFVSSSATSSFSCSR